ncbi:MAG: ABC transporter ATP-binding protein [Ruminococcaceae bacterium]|nr:ABC transporter ATP-binding protein [Oscillospiraceae bacterium]
MSKVRPEFDVKQIMKEQQNFLDCYSGERKGFLNTLFRFYKGHYKNLVIAALFFFIKTAPVWIIPIVTSNVINIATDKPPNAIFQLIINGVLIFLCVVQNAVTHTIYATHLSRAQRSVEAGLRGAMIRKLQQLSVGFHKDLQSGKIQSKVMRDVEAIENFTTQIFTTFLTVITNMTISLAIIIAKNITVFFMFLLCVPAAVLVTRFFSKKMHSRTHEFRVEMENASSTVLDMEELIPVTRAHALEKCEVKKMTANVTKVAERGYDMDKIYAIFGSINWVMFTIFQLVCLFFTGALALKGEISVGDITLYQSYFATLIGQVSSIISLMPIIAKGAESLNSIGEILSSHNVEDNQNKKKLQKLEGNYEFDNVFFNYPDDKTPVLRGLDLTVKAGETIALVGESGSGKSTILNLVIGFDRPNSGTVKIDGVDIHDIDMRSCRKFISVVPQNSILFSGTIKENITYGCPHITKEHLNYVIKAARLDSVIASMPKGINTVVGEHGAKLSGGQRQRISIARAIIRNPKVIIFDEATSALDSITEREIQEAIDNLTADRTTFIVAHRLSTIKNADKIAVIEKGRCVEFGTYDELMNKKGKFYELKQLQS